MEREKLKAASATGEIGEHETRVSDALPGPTSVSLGGREFSLTALDFNDLVTIEGTYPSVQEFFDEVARERMGALRFFFWIMLKKSAPELTIEAAGALIPLRASVLAPVMATVMSATGLQDDSNDPNETGVEANGATTPA